MPSISPGRRSLVVVVTAKNASGKRARSCSMTASLPTPDGPEMIKTRGRRNARRSPIRSSASSPRWSPAPGLMLTLATYRSEPESPVCSPGSSSATALPSDPVFVTCVHSPGHGGRFAKGCSVPDPYDVLTIAAIADELSATIGNGRIQRIGLLDPRTIGVEIYAGGQRHHMIASANDRQPRLRLAPDMPSLDSALVTPFGLLLRKHIRGGIILGIDQPPLERLVRFSIAKRKVPLKTRRDTSEPDLTEVEVDEREDDECEVHEAREGVTLSHVALYVELMGRHSNLILVDDDGSIMESAKRVTRDMSRVRPVLPRLPYIPPSPRGFSKRCRRMSSLRAPSSVPIAASVR